MTDHISRKRVAKRLRGNSVVMDDPKSLATMFEPMLSVPAPESYWIARNVDKSLFKVMQQMIPEVQCKADLQHNSHFGFAKNKRSVFQIVTS